MKELVCHRPPCQLRICENEKEAEKVAFHRHEEPMIANYVRANKIFCHREQLIAIGTIP